MMRRPRVASEAWRRRQRNRRVPGVRPRVKDERAYYGRLRRGLLDPLLDELNARFRFATSAAALQVALQDPLPGFEDLISQAARRSLTDMDAYHRAKLVSQFVSATRIDIGPVLQDAVVRPFLEARIRENVDLVKTVPRRLHVRLRERVGETFADAPFDREALRRVLRDEFRSSGYNLRRLTRDQNNKLVGQLSEVRQSQLGIQSYTWRTSQDERVRESHRSKNGQEFEWARPPSDTGHPGADIQCRCVASPVLASDFGEGLT